MSVKIYSKNFGFTVVELIVACAIAGIVVIGTSALYIGLQRIYINQARISQLQHQMRVAIDTMAREIRRAGYNPLGTNGTFGLNSTNPTSIYFTYDADEDGTLDLNETWKFRKNVNVLEYYNGTAWHGLTWKATEFPVEITSLNFYYYDNEGNVTAILNDTRTVQITITGRTALSATGAMYHQQTLNSQVKIRNLND